VTEPTAWVELGKISGTYGVKGWVKVFSYTEDKTGIFNYQPWVLRKNGRTHTIKVLQGRPQGKGIVAQLEGINDRDQAAELSGSEILIRRDQLPPAREGEYYWSDLIGMQVNTLQGEDLGQVDHLLKTGANDVLVIEGDRQRLVPFVQGQYVISIDLDERQMIVDRDPEF